MSIEAIDLETYATSLVPLLAFIMLPASLVSSWQRVVSVLGSSVFLDAVFLMLGVGVGTLLNIVVFSIFYVYIMYHVCWIRGYVCPVCRR